jgi:hypothetical protein
MNFKLPEFLSDAQWAALDDKSRHHHASSTIREVMAPLAKSGGDPWQLYHLDVATKAMGDRMFRAAETYARKAALGHEHRDVDGTIAKDGLPNLETLRSRFLENTSRTLGVKSKD